MTIDWSDEALKRERDKEQKDKKSSDYQGSGNMAYSRRDKDYVPKHEYEKTRGI